jgi:hypothetical protein
MFKANSVVMCNDNITKVWGKQKITLPTNIASTLSAIDKILTTFKG